MSNNNRKSQNSSLLGKILIGIGGVIGGLLIAKAVDEFVKPEQVPKQNKIKVDPTQYTKNIEEYDNIQSLMTCPITNCIMRKPVIIIQCGHTFEKEQIYKWVDKNRHCPLCNVATGLESLKPNYQLEQVIEEYLLRKKQERQAKAKEEKKEEKKEERKEEEVKKEQVIQKQQME